MIKLKLKTKKDDKFSLSKGLDDNSILFRVHRPSSVNLIGFNMYNKNYSTINYIIACSFKNIFVIHSSNVYSLPVYKSSYLDPDCPIFMNKQVFIYLQHKINL